MADHASFDFCFMLVYEGALFLRVALVADLVSRSIGPQLFRAKRSMWIMAIVALYQPFVHTMVERPGKFCPNIQVAGVTEVG
jgi:hypothetical protein